MQDEFLGCMDKRMQGVLREASAVAAHLADSSTAPTGVCYRTFRPAGICTQLLVFDSLFPLAEL